MEQMQKQAEHVGTEMFFDVITEVDFSKRPFEAKADSGDLYTGDTVIIATGAQARWLGLESERTYAGAGVSACATCDGFFFRGKEIALVGGGNTAVVLSPTSSVRMYAYRSNSSTIQRLTANFNDHHHIQTVGMKFGSIRRTA
jgi:thioredoxin reductase